jgi:hypothetical protein
MRGRSRERSPVGVAGTCARLVELMEHESKQLRLNAVAALYAISCAGRQQCKELNLLRVVPPTLPFLTPGLGRTAQDDQTQLFAALLLVNLVHAMKPSRIIKSNRPPMVAALMQAYDDTNEAQARTNISEGIRRLRRFDSASVRLKEGTRERAKSMAKRLSLSNPKKATRNQPTLPGRRSGNSFSGDYSPSFGGGGGGGGHRAY